MPYRALAITLCLAAAAAPAAAVYVDVTEEALGLPHNQVPGWTLVTWPDYNSDGWPDLHIGPDVLYVNNGDGTFTRAEGIGLEVEYGSGFRSVWADADNDGDLDCVQSNDMHSTVEEPSQVYYYDNGGAPDYLLTRHEIYAFPLNNRGQTAVFIDGDGDTTYELYQTSFGNWSPDYGISADRYFDGGGASWTDVTSTHIPELDLPEYRRHARGVVACDYDEDADIDIFVPNYGVAFGENWDNILWRNDGAGSFVDVATAAGVARETHGAYGIGLASGASWGDYDNDGDFDLVVANIHGWVAIYANDGAGNFTNVTAETGLQTGQLEWHNTLWADIDNDGDLDLFTCQWSGMLAYLYENEGPENLGHFRIANNDYGLSYLTYMRNTWGFAVADYDRDGDQDLYFSGGFDEHNGRHVFRNDLDPDDQEHHWLVLQLEGDGVTCGTPALGAQVRVRYPDGWSGLRQVECTSSDGTMNMMPVHFGLGSQEIYAWIQVQWPCGRTETWSWSDLGGAIDQWLTLVEGTGETAGAETEGARVAGLRIDHVRPTPAAYSAEAILSVPRAGSVTASLFDAGGRHVLSRSWAVSWGGRHARRLGVAELPPGVYSLLVESGGRSATRRVVILR
ncbi:MAG: hypothetical protein GF355_17905 [Candidatus Eisenbacteria bacterium]|nr:hypothetical protein [Candidatus Eisenbacteria bacterium]